MTNEETEGAPVAVELALTGIALMVVRTAVKKHEGFLKRARGSLEGVIPSAVKDIDDHLDVVRDELFPALGIDQEEEEKAGASTSPDPKQREMADVGSRDYRTHKFKNVQQTRELVARIIEESASPAAAVMALNRLEDGEKEREGGPRENHVRAIADARGPLATKAERLTPAAASGPRLAD